jgi:hypothetical protein
MPSPLSDIQDFITRYVALPNEHQSLVLSLWVMHTWTFSEMVMNPRTTPYIYVHSPEKQSGKTRLIEVLEPLVRNPMRATDMSPSVLFRAIEMMTPTILLDEVDAIWSGSRNEELRGTLNGGYKRGGHVWRTENLEPRQFATFCPKLLAGIDNGLLPDTIRDRSIPIVLQRKRKDQAVAPFYSYEIEGEIETLVAAIDAWTKTVDTTTARPKPIETISDRAWEISMPLIAIAAAIGKECETAARTAISELLVPTSSALSPGSQLLSDIRDAFNEAGTDRIFTAQILEKLGGDWNGKLLGNRLTPYGVSARTIRVGNQTGRGFYLREFTDLWERYL